MLCCVRSEIVLITCPASEDIQSGFTLFTRSEVRSRASCRHYIAYLYDRARMRMLTHDNIEQKDREKLKYKANINIGEVGNTSLRQSGLVSIKVDHVAMLYCLILIS